MSEVTGSAALGPAGKPSESPESDNPFGDAYDVPEEDPKAIHYDRWGRYANLPAIPGVCGVQPWTRVTTVGKVLDDTYFLDLWKRRQVVIGIKRKPELLDGITERMLKHVDQHRVTPMPKRTKDLINAIADQAMDGAGSYEGAAVGTAFHTLMEVIDAGDMIDRDTITEDDALMIDAYAELIKAEQIKMIPNMIERVIAIPSLGLAGRLDRIVTDHGVPRIGDVKSQASMDFGHISLAVQLACYANAEYMLDQSTEPWTWIKMPEVDKDLGVVIWTPATQPGVAEIIDVDLRKGWQYAKASVKIREWRKDQGIVTRRPRSR